MATITATHAKVAKGVHKVIWLTLTETNTDGSPYGPDEGGPFNPDKTFHCFGTWGGGTLVIQGSNDGVNWLTLTDIHSNAASYTADAIDTIAENPLYIRPLVTAGTGVDLDVILSAHGVRPVR